MAGTREQLARVVDILHELGPARCIVLSTLNTVPAGARAKTTVWSRLQLGEADPLNKGIPRVQGLGITLLGAPVGYPGHVEVALMAQVTKVAEVLLLLHTLKDPHTEFGLLRWCLSLPKVMHLLLSTPTIGHEETLEDFDHLILHALTDILGADMPELQTRQASLLVAMGGLGLQAATDHATAAHVSSIVASKDLFRAMLGMEEDQPSPGTEAEAPQEGNTKFPS